MVVVVVQPPCENLVFSSQVLMSNDFIFEMSLLWSIWDVVVRCAVLLHGLSFYEISMTMGLE